MLSRSDTREPEPWLRMWEEGTHEVDAISTAVVFHFDLNQDFCESTNRQTLLLAICAAG